MNDFISFSQTKQNKVFVWKIFLPRVDVIENFLEKRMYLVKLNAGHIFGLSLLPTNIFFQVSLYENYDLLKYEIDQ